MGFIDYAWAVSFQKDNTKVKILQDPNIDRPTLQPDEYGFTIKLPMVQFLEDGNISFLGQVYPHNQQGKTRVGRLFRASVLHLTTHTLTQLPNEIMFPNDLDSPLEAFCKALARDTFVNAYLEAWYPDRFVDIAYANTCFYEKMKPVSHIFSPSTRVMTALLTRLNIGQIKGTLKPEEDKTVNDIMTEISGLKEALMSTFMGEQIDPGQVAAEKIKTITGILEPYGPFLEAPSLVHTESTGKCSIYSVPEAKSWETNLQAIT